MPLTSSSTAPKPITIAKPTTTNTALGTMVKTIPEAKTFSEVNALPEIKVLPEMKTLPVGPVQPYAIPMNHAPSALRQVRQTVLLDHSGELAVDISVDRTTGKLDLAVEQRPFGHRISGEAPPKGVLEGMEIRVNGEVVNLEAGAVPFAVLGPKARWNGATTIDRSQPAEVTVSLHGKVLTRIEVDPAKALITPRPEAILTASDVRILAKGGAPAAANLDQAASKGLSPTIDLHTHFAGAMPAEAVLKVGIENKAPFYTALLDKLGIGYRPEDVIEMNGQPAVRLGEAPLTGPNGKDPLELIKTAMSVKETETVSFETFEQMYKFRDPITKNVELFGPLLREIALDYQATGVRYTELSLADITEPAWLAAAKEWLPRIEAETGVQIRFLVGLRRSHPAEKNLKRIEALEKVDAEGVVVGVDIMGNEQNPTSSVASVIERAVGLKNRWPTFQVRVHAGENPLYPANVKEAIELGATRIGHGVYGVTPEVLAQAKEKGVIIEINLSSNVALQNIANLETVSLKKYLDSGVRVTLGSDGTGIFKTSTQAEAELATRLGLKPQDLAAIQRSDDLYLEAMSVDRSEG
jgi:hypothetical protein